MAQPETIGYRAGQVIVKGQSRALACTLQNLSSGGALLAFAIAVDLPPEFELEAPSLSLRLGARVTWNRAELHGVEFIWPQHERLGKPR
ncbi:PilZ domain-containing protein [Microvirga ossetica]|uniref:PilZ domain-containing protein n=1 Tax=Microvirga ossetica TaxID=1882682 RepID=UPI003AAA6755